MWRRGKRAAVFFIFYFLKLCFKVGLEAAAAQNNLRFRLKITYKY